MTSWVLTPLPWAVASDARTKPYGAMRQRAVSSVEIRTSSRARSALWLKGRGRPVGANRPREALDAGSGRGARDSTSGQLDSDPSDRLMSARTHSG